MAITVTDLSTLDVESVQAQLDTLSEMLQNLDPDADLRRGTIHDVILYLSAILAQANQDNIDKVRRSNSLLAIEADPTLADDDVLDRVASNYKVTRKEGVLASGEIILILPANFPTIIPAFAEFVADGVTFATSSVFVGRTLQADVVSDTDRLISSNVDGTYSFLITVTATEVGEAGNLSRGTQLIPTDTLANVTSAYTYASFLNGRDEEGNSELSNRLAAGISSRTISSRTAIDGMIRGQEEFEDVLQTSIIGYGDLEQIRYHSILPVAFGGRIDTYIRTSDLFEEVVLHKTATLQSKTIDMRGVWAFTFTREDAPGFYEISKIALDGTSTTAVGYAVGTDTRSFNVTPNTGDLATNSTTFLPDITLTKEADFSRYSTGAFTFTDTTTDTTALVIGATKVYDVVVRQMPLIREIQDFVSGRDVRNPASDCLIKAPIPCFMTTTITLNVKRNTEEPDEDAIKTAIAGYVNNLGFAGSISTAAIASQIYSVVPSTTFVNSVSLSGRLRKPNNLSTTLGPSTTSLSFTDDAPNMVTTRTVCFFIRTSDITIALTTID